jgi:hypothetical protein
MKVYKNAHITYELKDWIAQGYNEKIRNLSGYTISVYSNAMMYWRYNDEYKMKCFYN